MVHDSKRQPIPKVFFSTLRKYFQFFTATLITDREASIENAVAKICPTWKHFNCGNYLLNNVKFWLHRHNAKSHDLLVYQNHIWSLLNCASCKKFNGLERQVKDTWTRTFYDYYETQLSNDPVDGCLKRQIFSVEVL